MCIDIHSQGEWSLFLSDYHVWLLDVKKVIISANISNKFHIFHLLIHNYLTS
jgi:hypothetical protein